MAVEHPQHLALRVGAAVRFEIVDGSQNASRLPRMTTALSLRSHAPAHSKSKRVEPDFSFTIEPDSGTDEFGLVVPGSASNDAIIGIAALEPCRTIDWCAIVAVVPNVFHPFPDVAVHVEEPKRIGPE